METLTYILHELHRLSSVVDNLRENVLRLQSEFFIETTAQNLHIQCLERQIKQLSENYAILEQQIEQVKNQLLFEDEQSGDVVKQ